MSPVEPVPGSQAPNYRDGRTRPGERPLGPSDGTYGATTGAAVRCLTCRTVIQSGHRHHMARCDCPDNTTAVWVDGGTLYTRIAGGPDARWVPLDDSWRRARGAARLDRPAEQIIRDLRDGTAEGGQ